MDSTETCLHYSEACVQQIWSFLIQFTPSFAFTALDSSTTSQLAIDGLDQLRVVDHSDQYLWI